MSADIRVIDNSTRVDRASNEVHAAFAEAYDDMLKETGGMSAFFIVCFDHSGAPVSMLHMGTEFPIPPPMLPEIVKQCAITQVYTP